MARYLLNTAPNDYERRNPVKLMFGNGLRPQIWEEVRRRFKVNICEFYGATEGNCSMGNNAWQDHYRTVSLAPVQS